MKYVATIANFFLPGLGHLIAGPSMDKRILGLPMAIAMGVLTYVELGVKTQAPALYLPMFLAVFLFNTAFAVDTYRGFKSAEPAHA